MVAWLPLPIVAVMGGLQRRGARDVTGAGSVLGVPGLCHVTRYARPPPPRYARLPPLPPAPPTLPPAPPTLPPGNMPPAPSSGSSPCASREQQHLRAVQSYRKGEGGGAAERQRGLVVVRLGGPTTGSARGKGTMPEQQGVVPTVDDQPLPAAPSPIPQPRPFPATAWHDVATPLSLNHFTAP